jgi:hypothetical protein
MGVVVASDLADAKPEAGLFPGTLPSVAIQLAQ